MRTYVKLSTAVVILLCLMMAAMNVFMLRGARSDDRSYKVEAKRAADEIKEKGSADISKYPHITGIYTDEDELYESREHYLIMEVNGRLYRVEYILDRSSRRAFISANCFFAGGIVITVLLLVYIGRHIIRPFSILEEVPKELAKGNLAVDIPEDKSRFLGRFTWGINLMRETIEESRLKEIRLQREKKLLLLSLSHDVKTPLSSIKLNARALERGLYKDPEKQQEAAASINARADEIESFITQITKASSEDFMSFEVEMGEEFLDRIIGRLDARYSSQLALSSTDFIIDSHRDCLLSCDPDRLAECLQNLIENAVKYGDGREIRLSFEQMDGCQLITVSNSGCSLSPAELPVIFESFHRGTNSSKVQGNGLGLFICRKLMTQMNGEVYAEIKDGRFSVTLVTRLA